MPVGANASPPVMVSVTPESVPVSAIRMVAGIVVDEPPDVFMFTMRTRTPPEVLVEDAGV